MILSFADKEAERLWRTGKSIRHALIAAKAHRALHRLDEAVVIENLRSPPGNRLERLKGDRNGQWSIRIDRQWRICFEWENGNASRVEIVDYH
ncbi:MAG: type II toxin-antitoxin system RelE/ParE family toxin [Erythrobacter sp.]|jgi:proteic killer suppression protein